MFRISNRMMYNNTLINAFRNNQGLLKAQEQLSSGKRINRPSDDPVGMMEVLTFRTRIGKAEQYLRVMGNAESILATADSTLGSIHDVLKKNNELALQQAGGLASPETRITAAQDIDNAIEQMIQFGNTKIGPRYVFSGQNSDIQAIDLNGGYQGSGKDLNIEISEGLEIPISVRASEFLSADMNPAVSAVDGVTLLTSLNSGAGVPAGAFNITDRAGTVAAINTAAMTDVEDVITAINGAGLNIVASISSDGTAIVLTDSTNPALNNLTVESNSTSIAIGLAGSRPTSTFTGDDLNPAMTGSTLLSDLYGGTGLTLNNITINNSSASATVTFAAETTVQDVINTINAAGAGIGVTVAIDSAGRKLDITSGVATTVAFATDLGSGKTAELLGIGGGRNVIPVLKMLSAALKADDTAAILGAIGLLGSSMDKVNSVRGSVGARANQVVVTREAVDQTKFETTKIKSFVEDADFLKAASELAMLQTAYQATLKSSAAIIQPSLLDFI